jgi:hypothetical protein
MDMKLEVVVVPVSGVDRAKDESAGQMRGKGRRVGHERL